MLKPRRSTGFTLMELGTVVVIIGILVSIAIANYNSAQNKSKMAVVKANMHSLQIGIEAYATATGGFYPPAPADIAPFAPGGSNTVGGNAGTFPTNPLSGASNEMPATGQLNSTALITAARASGASSNLGGGTKGQTTYVSIPDETRQSVMTSYAVTGVDDRGNDVLGTYGKLVLSNQ